MFYSFFAAIFLALVAVSTSDLYTNDLQNVLARFYTNFAHLYVRYPPTSADTLGLPADPSVEYYQFLFTAKGYSQIAEESLSMLNTHVLERTVTYHPTPNFEMNDTRYFYRRDPKQRDAIEIESVDSFNQLFRDPRTDRYFYLSSFEGLEFMGNIPASPYYEVVFKCNSSFTQDTNSQLPVLSFIDRTYKWTPRYLLDAPMFGGNNRSLMLAYADIRNTGENDIAIKALELIAGSIELIDKSVNYMPSSSLHSPSVVTFAFSAPRVSSLGEQASGTYVYQWPVPSDINLTSTSVKSIEFLQADVTVESFLVYSSAFSTINGNGKLNRAYNLTCRNAYLPEGRLILREQGRFVGEINLPNLGMGEVYTMKFGFDAEVTYHRYVTITQGDANAESITYNVRYMFESYKPSRDIYLDFTESVWSAGYFEVKNISKLNKKSNSPAVKLIGTDLRGQIIIPHKPDQQVFSYDVTMYKLKPTTIRDQ